MPTLHLQPSSLKTHRASVPPPEAPRAPVGGLWRGWLGRQLARRLAGVSAEILLPGGTRFETGAGRPIASIEIRDLRILPRLLWNAELAFGEAYESGSLVVRGDLVGFLEAVYRQQLAEKTARSRHERRVRARPISVRAARRNIHHHYDLGNDFYRLWLDPELLYTCAYYASPETDLAVAQMAKMEHICRKLTLTPADRVVEAGCGWGALALYMARRYGVEVRAYNISTEQIRYARERARAEGLDTRVQFIEDDYRSIRGPFDVFVSVGMLEHVGLANYGTLGEIIDRGLTRPGGRGLIHFIGRDRPEPISPWIDRRIFPGAYPPTLAEMVRGVLEPFGFSVVDVENLRRHYARTLSDWLARFEASAPAVAAMFDERFVRAWRLYLAGSQAAFAVGSLQLFQVLFVQSGGNPNFWLRPGSTVLAEQSAGIDGTA